MGTFADRFSRARSINYRLIESQLHLSVFQGAKDVEVYLNDSWGGVGEGEGRAQAESARYRFCTSRCTRDTRRKNIYIIYICRQCLWR